MRRTVPCRPGRPGRRAVRLPGAGALVLAAVLGLLVAASGPAAAQAPGTSPALAAATDALVFATPLPAFSATRAAAPPGYDWSSDGCSVPFVHEPGRSRPRGFDFLPACERHDFGYRNLKAQGRFDEDVRRRVDDGFLADMDAVCATYAGTRAWRGVECRHIAADYHFWVRSCGAAPAPYCPLVAREFLVRHLDL